jgi:ribosomal protein S6E (S10)
MVECGESVVLKRWVGFNPQNEGERRRKRVRGNVITDEIVQVNMKIVERPKGKKTGESKEKPPSAQDE